MSATPPVSPRVRRAPTRPSFDPKTQPWVPSSLKFGAVPATHLNPEWLRAVLSKNIERQLDIPNEASDIDVQDTALRETEEETGLLREHIECLGGLPRYLTGSGFAINPVTALVRPGFTLAPDEFEVAEVFEVPLSFLTDPANYRFHQAHLPDGGLRQFYSVPYNQFFIWGATAAMLLGLCQVLSEAAAES